MDKIKLKVRDVTGSAYAIEPKHGEFLFLLIMTAFKKNKTVTLDFHGVELFTSAFFSTSIGVLYQHYDDAYLNRKLLIINLSPDDISLLGQNKKEARLYFKLKARTNGLQHYW